VQNCRSDKDSGSDIDVDLQIHADVHARRASASAVRLKVLVCPANSNAARQAFSGRKRRGREPVPPRPAVDRSQFMSLERPCRLCKSGLEHPYHLLFECTAGGFPALHKLLLQSAALQYWRILSQTVRRGRLLIALCGADVQRRAPYGRCVFWLVGQVDPPVRRRVGPSCPRLFQVLRLQTLLTQNHWRQCSVSTSTRSAGAAACAMLR
jgi:hypothetical protein